MQKQRNKREIALKKELAAVEKQEKRLQAAAEKAASAGWKTALERKIPEKVAAGLESAFCKGFSLVFRQGSRIIEKTYRKSEIQADYAIRDYAVQVKGGKKELRAMHRSAKQSDAMTMAITAVEGIGLGALGIGMPDVVLFLSMLLKGVYETALRYGFDYESQQEQWLILKMLQTALSKGEDWRAGNEAVDALLVQDLSQLPPPDLKPQLQATAAAFAVDMLLLKFIQGIPVVGILGGAANPVYYRKIMNYVQLKYRRRYLQAVAASKTTEESV